MKLKNEKGFTLVALILIIILLVITSSVIAVVVVNNKNLEKSNNVVDNNTTSDNEQDKQSTEYYSILDHLPEFSETQKDSSTILWTSGIPLNANPLTYQNGSYVNGLYYYNQYSYFKEDISLSAEEISNIKINGDNSNLSQYSSSLESNDIYFCRLRVLNPNGGSSLYEPVCYETENGSKTWNSDYYKNVDMTLGESFEKGLFSAETTFYNFAEKQGKDANNLSAQERMDLLIEVLGNPSGLYWRNSNDCITKGKVQYTTFEEFKNGNKNSEEKRTKTYYLVWDYGDCYITVELYENPGASSGTSATETSITNMSLFQNVDIYDAFNTNTTFSSLIDGYIGYGQAPGQLRYKGSPLSATE